MKYVRITSFSPGSLVSRFACSVSDKKENHFFANAYEKETKHNYIMAATKKAVSKKEDKKCWEGYKQVPGKKAGEKGSCEKK